MDVDKAKIACFNLARHRDTTPYLKEAIGTVLGRLGELEKKFKDLEERENKNAI